MAKAGRPPLKDESLRRDKKVMLTFTEEEYESYKKMQNLLNQSTLTSTLMLFIKKGREAYAQELTQSL